MHSVAILAQACEFTTYDLSAVPCSCGVLLGSFLGGSLSLLLLDVWRPLCAPHHLLVLPPFRLIMVKDGERSRSRERAAGAPTPASSSDYITRSDLDAILEGVEVRIQDSFKVSSSEVKATFSSALRQYDEGAQRRFSHIESDVTVMQKRLDASENDAKKLWGSLESLQRSMAVAESAVPLRDDFSDETFTREIDATILWISSEAILTKPAVLASIVSWLAEANLDESHYELMGLDTSKKFTLQFKGNAGIAANRLSKAAALLRSRDGQWKDFHATLLSEGSERFYISRDKNGAQIKRELDTKRLADAWRTVCTDRSEFHTNKSDGVISVNWVPIVNSLVTNPLASNGTSKWISENTINHEAVDVEYRRLARPKNEVSWTCL